MSKYAMPKAYIESSTRVWKNPWRSEIAGILTDRRGGARSGALRGLVGGSDLYLWDAKEMTHDDAEDYLQSNVPVFISPSRSETGEIDAAAVVVLSLEEHSQWFGEYGDFMKVVPLGANPVIFSLGMPKEHVRKYLTRG